MSEKSKGSPSSPRQGERGTEGTMTHLEKVLEREPPSLLTLVHLIDAIDLANSVNRTNDESLASADDSPENLVRRRISSYDKEHKSVPIYFSVYPHRPPAAEPSTTDDVVSSSSLSSSTILRGYLSSSSYFSCFKVLFFILNI